MKGNTRPLIEEKINKERKGGQKNRKKKIQDYVKKNGTRHKNQRKRENTKTKKKEGKGKGRRKQRYHQLD